MLPLLLIGALAFILVSSKDEPSGPTGPTGPTGPQKPGPGVPPLPPGLCPGLENLPPELRRGMEDLIRSGSAPGLLQAAATARQLGQEELAECLEDYAAKAVGAPPAKPGDPTDSPWDIPGPDTGYPTPLPGGPMPGTEPSLLDYCPEAANLPAPILQQLDALLATPGTAAQLQQAAATIALMGQPAIAQCITGLAQQKAAGLI